MKLLTCILCVTMHTCTRLCYYAQLKNLGMHIASCISVLPLPAYIMCYNALCLLITCYNALCLHIMCYNALCRHIMCYNALCRHIMCHNALCLHIMCYSALCQHIMCYNALCLHIMCYNAFACILYNVLHSRYDVTATQWSHVY